MEENNYEKPPEIASAEDSAAAAEEGNMSLIRHLEELRKCLIRSFIAIGIGTGIAYFFLDEIMHYLRVASRQAVLHAAGRGIFYLSEGIGIRGFSGRAARCLF